MGNYQVEFIRKSTVNYLHSPQILLLSQRDGGSVFGSSHKSPELNLENGGDDIDEDSKHNAAEYEDNPIVYVDQMKRVGYGRADSDDIYSSP